MSNVLVTGGAGFIGSFIVDALIKEGHAVRILDNLEHSIHGGKVPTYLNGQAEFQKGDVTDAADVEKALDNIDVVFHEAALVGIEPSMKDPKKFMNTNSLGTANLLSLLIRKNFGVKKVIVPSTVGIYGEGDYSCQKCGTIASEFRKAQQLKKSLWEAACPKCNSEMVPVRVKESKPVSISNVYSLSKFDQEVLCQSVGRSYGIPVVALRYFNVYGPRQSSINPYSGVITKFVGNALEGKPMIMFEDGGQTRDFISVHDIARANLLAMKSSKGDFKSFNVGTGKGTSIRKIAETIKDASKSSSEIVVSGKYREGDIRHCTADGTFIEKTLGFRAQMDLKEGLGEVVEWYRKGAG